MDRKRYHLLSEAEKDRIMELVEQGVMKRHIAERFDVVPVTISKVIRDRRKG